MTLADVYIPDVLFGVYILALIGLFAVVMREVVRDVFRDPMQRTVGTLAAVFAVQLCYIAAVGEWGQEFAFIALDATAAAVILFRPAGWAQAMIGLTYLLQMSMHAAKAALNEWGPGFDPMTYWWFVTAAAFLQLIIAGGWWLYVRFGNGHPLRGTGKNAVEAHSRGTQG